MVEQFKEWQLEEVQSILALEEGTAIKNKHEPIKNKHWMFIFNAFYSVGRQVFQI